jgi:hypothetical protein
VIGGARSNKPDNQAAPMPVGSTDQIVGGWSRNTIRNRSVAIARRRADCRQSFLCRCGEPQDPGDRRADRDRVRRVASNRPYDVRRLHAVVLVMPKRAAASDITMLLGEQNVTFGLPHADRVYVIEHARIVWEGDPAGSPRGGGRLFVAG